MEFNVFSTRLRARRQEVGFTQDELAQKSGLSRNTIQQLERKGNPRSDNLLALSRVLSVSTDWLLGQDVTGGYEPGASGSRLRVSDLGSGSIMDDRPLSAAPNILMPMVHELDEKETYNYALVPLAEAVLRKTIK